MPRPPVKRLLISTALFASVTLAESSGAALVLGGFDASRGGDFSLETGSHTANLRTHLASAFPGVSYRSSAVLTAAFLSTIDVLFISAPFDVFSAITPLTAAEKMALFNFVSAGRGALIFADNNQEFEPASDSMVSPFGVDATGRIEGSATGTVTNTTHPVTNGPFGAVTTFTDAAFPGWFGGLGMYAEPLARLDVNNQIALAVIDPGKITATSGGVVFFSDTKLNTEYTGSTLILLENAIAFAVPEPFASSLALPGIVLLAICRRRKR